MSAVRILATFPVELAAALTTVLLYLPAVGFGFVFDDEALIAADGRPLALGGALPYRPLRYASYFVDRWLGGTAAVYHADNVLLHALVAALVVALARRLGSGRGAALAGGLLVAFHPLSVEAAAYVAGRRDLLCVALGLGALLCHRSGSLAGASLLLVASAAAKESGLVFAAPLVAMTLAGLDGRAAVAAPRAALAAAGGIAAAATLGVVLALAYGAIGPWGPSLDAAGLALPGRVAAHYASGLLGLHTLAPDYPQLLEYVARVHAGDIVAASGGVAATALLAASAAASWVACVRARRAGRGSADSVAANLGAREHGVESAAGLSARESAFVWAWTMSAVAALALWGGLHEPGADRHAYLLLPALAVGAARLLSSAALAVAAPSVRRGVFVVAALVLVMLAGTTQAQMQVWRSNRALWTHAAAGPSPSPRTHANLARVLAVGGDYATAINHMKAAVAADPENPSLYLGRAALRCAQDRPVRARRDLDLARRRGATPESIAALAGECPLPRLRHRAGPAA